MNRPGLSAATVAVLALAAPAQRGLAQPGLAQLGLAWPELDRRATAAPEVPTSSPAEASPSRRRTAAADSLTLAAVLRRVLDAHPALAAADARLRASRSRTRALLRPANPELEAAAGGSGPFDELVGGLDVAFPLRPRGQAAALGRAGEAERAALAADRSVAAAELLAAAAGGYAGLLAAAWDEALAREELEVARDVEEHARRRMELSMGGDLPVLQAQILADEALARIEEARGRGRAAAARLSALGAGPVAAEAASDTGGGFEAGWRRLQSLPARADTAGPPAVRAARARAAAAESEVAVVRASRRPAPRLGVRAERDTGGELELFLLAGLALPVFDRGREAIAAARTDAEAARLDALADSLAVAGDLSGALVEHEVATAALRRLVGEALPRARRLEAAARANVEAGGTAFLIWLEARRSWLGLRRRELELRRSAAAAALEARRLTGDFADLLEDP